MLFNQIRFLVFFGIVYALYWLLRKDCRKQNVMLLLASYAFYGFWNWKFVPILWVTTIFDFVTGQLIAKSEVPARRRFFLAVSVTLNLILLGFFKYFNWGMASVQTAMHWLGMEVHPYVLDVILPVGISFYTFQSISYTMDVYRRKTPPTRDLLGYALYVAFFPQLVAGPIQQATALLPQLQQPRTVTRDDLRVGFLWILLGYFKKMVLADTLAPLVSYGFDHSDAVSGVTSLAVILAFTVQIYGDFAGYTLIARGLARLLGVKLGENFHMPYLAVSPREFWSRWHISLSTWLRDYLYIPLGGNRGGLRRTCINLLLTMLLAGLWHGANWTFVIWGGYYGVLLVLCHLFLPKAAPSSARVRVVSIVLTFGFTLFGWLLFRAQSLDQVGKILCNIVCNFHWTAETGRYVQPTVTLFLLLMAYHVWLERSGDVLVVLKINRWLRRGLYLFLVLSSLAVGFKGVPFIYFQF